MVRCSAIMLWCNGVVNFDVCCEWCLQRCGLHSMLIDSNLYQTKAALIRGHISPRTLSGPVKHSGWLQGDKKLTITASQRVCRGELGTQTANRKDWVEYCPASECRLTTGVLDLKSPKQTHSEISWDHEKHILKKILWTVQCYYKISIEENLGENELKLQGFAALLLLGTAIP